MSDEPTIELTVLPSPYPDLTARQRVCFYLFNSLANDLERGSAEDYRDVIALCRDCHGKFHGKT